jgi:hypothetical protein
LLEADVDGELIALSVDSGTCYGFNPTATRIWALLEQPKSLSALCDALVADFEVDRATCERDVVALLDDLRKDGLIEVKGILPGGAA